MLNTAPSLPTNSRQVDMAGELLGIGQNLLKTEITWMAENAPHLDFSLALKRAEAGVRGSASPDLHLEQMKAK